MLELGDHVRCPHVIFATDTEGILATDVEHVAKHGIGGEGRQMRTHGFFGNFIEANTADLAGGARKVVGDEVGVEADRLEDLRSTVRQVGRNTHLRHDLVEAFVDRLDVVLQRILGLVTCQVLDGGIGKPRADRLGAIGSEEGELMDLAYRAGIDDDAGACPQAFAHEVMVSTGAGKQRGDRDAIARYAAITEDQDVEAVGNRMLGAVGNSFQGPGAAFGAFGNRVGDVHHQGLETSLGQLVDRAQAATILFRQHGLVYFQARRQAFVIVGNAQQVGPRADEAGQRHDNFFANRIDRRIGDLGEDLLEVGVQGLVLA